MRDIGLGLSPVFFGIALVTGEPAFLFLAALAALSGITASHDANFKPGFFKRIRQISTLWRRGGHFVDEFAGFLTQILDAFGPAGWLSSHHYFG